jgi:hypothetical protein
MRWPYNRRVEAVHAWGALTVAVGLAGAIAAELATVEGSAVGFRWWWPSGWMAIPAGCFVLGLLLLFVPLRRSPPAVMKPEAISQASGGSIPLASGQSLVPLAGQEILGQPPGLPRRLVLRPNLLLDIVQLIDAGGHAVAVTGIGGSGKSTLAAAALLDPRVRQQFRDGVTWLEAGPGADPAALLSTLGRRLGVKELGTGTVQQVTDILVNALRDKHLLIAVDNVWSRDPLDALMGLGSHCVVLFTTRRRDLALAFDAAEVQVGELTSAQAQDLLASWIGLPDKLGKELPEAGQELCARLGNLALGVAVAGAMVRSGQSCTDVLALINTSFSRVQAELNPRYAYVSLYAAIDAGIGDLSPKDQQYYLDLAAVGRGEFPRKAAEALWRTALSEAGAGNLLATLVGRSLLIKTPAGLYELHDVQYDVLAQRLGALPGFQVYGRSLVFCGVSVHSAQPAFR